MRSKVINKGFLSDVVGADLCVRPGFNVEIARRTHRSALQEDVGLVV
jgi:hypothetical protein